MFCTSGVFSFVLSDSSSSLYTIFDESRCADWSTALLFPERSRTQSLWRGFCDVIARRLFPRPVASARPSPWPATLLGLESPALHGTHWQLRLTHHRRGKRWSTETTASTSCWPPTPTRYRAHGGCGPRGRGAGKRGRRGSGQADEKSCRSQGGFISSPKAITPLAVAGLRGPNGLEEERGWSAGGRVPHPGSKHPFPGGGLPNQERSSFRSQPVLHRLAELASSLALQRALKADGGGWYKMLILAAG